VYDSLGCFLHEKIVAIFAARARTDEHRRLLGLNCPVVSSLLETLRRGTTARRLFGRHAPRG